MTWLYEQRRGTMLLSDSVYAGAVAAAATAALIASCTFPTLCLLLRGLSAADSDK